MSDELVRLKKLRTFYDDISKLQKSSPDVEVSEKNEPKTITPNDVIDPPATTEMWGIKKSESKFRPEPSAPITEIPKDLPNEVEPRDQPKLPEIDVSLIKKENKNSILSGHGSIFSTIEEGNETVQGNIITDQKRKRFKLFPAIGTALADWFNKKQKQVTDLIETKEDSPEISDVTTRTEVVKEAAFKSKLAPSDDYSQITKRIKKVFKTNPSANTLVIKKATEVAEPSWTYLDDGSDSDKKTSSPEPEMVEEETVKDTLPPPVYAEAPIPKINDEITEVAVSDETAPELEPVKEVLPAVEPQPLPVLETLSEPVIEDVTQDLPANVEVEPDQDSDTDLSWFAPTVKISETENHTELETPAPAKTFSASRQQTFPLWRITAIVVLAIALGVSFSLWLFGGEENTLVIDNQNQFNSLIKSDEQIPISLGSDTKTLLRNIQAIQSKPTSIVTVAYPTVNIAGIDQPASAADILNTLSWNASGNFLRNITDINFGLYRNKDPFIILKVTSFDSAFGGILNWENTMSADLSPLFGPLVSGTFDPQARNATQIRSPYFIDVVVENIDSRLLTDETQKERIIYAFSDRNTIIITTSKSTLGDLLNLRR